MKINSNLSHDKYNWLKNNDGENWPIGAKLWIGLSEGKS
jgi:hypothetical protein